MTIRSPHADTLLDPASHPEVNAHLARLDAQARIAWALGRLPGSHVLSSSFGVQSAVLLHMVTQQQPGIPVVLIDTGYLFPETYRFIDELTDRLRLDVRVYRPALSPAWLEARHGRLWEQGEEGLDRYGEIVKSEPMRRALRELGAGTWFAGLRRGQARSRADIGVLGLQQQRFKVYPIFDWTDRDVAAYLRAHELPYHPLWDQGYPSVGDWHTTRSLSEAGSTEATRFYGLRRECSLHDLPG